LHDLSHSFTTGQAENDVSEKAAPLSANTTASNTELLQLEFKPSIDELIIFEGKVFLIRSLLNISSCYAYLTSKRYALCDSSGVHIIFQVGTNGFASVNEDRHLLSKKIIIQTVSGEIYQVKKPLHHIWFRALRDPQGFAAGSTQPNSDLPTESATAPEWYYRGESGEEIGPIREKDMIQLIRNNHTIYRDTSVWNIYLTTWKRAEETVLSFYFRESPSSAVAVKVSNTLWRSIVTHIGLFFKRYL
jgi:hypothetical protein